MSNKEEQMSLKSKNEQSNSLIKYERTKSQQTRERIIAALASPDNAGLTQEELARKIGVSSRTIRKHIKSDSSIVKEARELFHRLYVPNEMVKIDRAMLAKAAEERDVPAAKLMYRVFDGIGDQRDIRDSEEFEFILTCREDSEGIRAKAGFRVRPRKD